MAQRSGRPHTATFTRSYHQSATTSVITQRLRQEVGEIADARGQASIEQTETQLIISVEAADLTALRAGINTWLRLVTVAESVHALGDTISDNP